MTRFNVGELQNTGVEFSLNGSLIQSKDLSFDLGLNWSTNQNEIVALTGETQVDPDTGETYFIDIVDSSGRRLSIGQSINNLWLPEYAGIYQESDFLDGSPVIPELGSSLATFVLLTKMGMG